MTGYYLQLWSNGVCIVCQYSQRGWNYNTAYREAMKCIKNELCDTIEIIDGSGYYGVVSRIYK